MQKAWVLESVGNINYKDVEVPQPAEGEALIRVKAAGICGSDVPRTYQNGAHKMPLIIGHEFSGEVENVGEGVSSELKGRRVAVFPKIACKKCKHCISGHQERCENYDYVGSRRDGAFAEYVTAPAENLLELTEGVSFEEAAMMEPMAVAAHAVRMVTEKSSADAKTKTIAVCGLGTIGLLLIMFLQEAGYKNIYAIGNKESQKKRITELGIAEEYFCDSKKEDAITWLNEKTGGVNLYFECVGKNEAINAGIESLAPAGDLILVGNPYSDMNLPKNTYWKILRKELKLHGVWNSVFPTDWEYVLERLAAGKIKPAALISHRFPLDHLKDGLEIMRNKTEDYCKVMINT